MFGIAGGTGKRDADRDQTDDMRLQNSTLPIGGSAVDAAELPTAYQSWFPSSTGTTMCNSWITAAPSAGAAGLGVSEVAELPVNVKPDARLDFNDLT
jgi:hypothetical protein